VPFAVSGLRARLPGIRFSRFYWTVPLGGCEQPHYINGVAAGIEDRAGRVRDPDNRFAGRTLDLDLLLCGTTIDSGLDLPSVDLLERVFVLVPAAELMPDLVHPVLRRTLSDLAAERFPPPYAGMVPLHEPRSEAGPA
jgi:2-amino-4-hydroxy-6-hydroxymethyldihydropteridine diphosphokinase